MRICHLSKSQDLTLSRSSKSPKGCPKCHQIFRLLNFNKLKSPGTSKALRSRNIIPESYSLPFQAHAKLFHALPPKKVRKKK